MDVKDLVNKEDMVLKEPVIYAIINIFDWKLYIGSAVQARRRKQEHLSKLRTGKHYNLHLQRAFNKHGEDNFKFVVLTKVSDIKNLERYEQIWIDKFDFEKQLYNFCRMAGNTTGRIVTDITRKKISDKNRGKKMSDENKKKLSERSKGRKLSKETIAKVVEKKNKRCAKIDLKTGEVLQIFPSFQNAAESLSLKKAGDLINCARGKIGSSHGFSWKYIDKEDLHLNNDYISKPKTNGAKPVEVYNKDTNELIRSFSSVSEAVRKLNLSENCIGNACKAATIKNKIAYGYKWKYIDK